jgi:hypothetical protein
MCRLQDDLQILTFEDNSIKTRIVLATDKEYNDLIEYFKKNNIEYTINKYAYIFRDEAELTRVSNFLNKFDIFN